MAELIYVSANGMYDQLAGGRERSHRVLERAFARKGTSASAEVVTLCEDGGNVAGAMAAFPAEEAAPRSQAFIRLTLRSIPPWTWPRSLRLYVLGARAASQPPGRCLYVDALATDPAARRRGVARALLEEAESRARGAGLGSLALDTVEDNRAARALYVDLGFEEMARSLPRWGMPGVVALVKEL